ncbi:MAG: OmpA family protein [Deltaproteobacteria bacterium]|nr:OmpA family protein [Deltaproteobacteria bacterium]
MRTGLIALLLLGGCPKPVDYPDGMGIEGQLDREITALIKKVGLLEDQLATCQQGPGAPLALYQTMHQLLSSTEVEVTQEAGEILILYPADHLFRIDGVTIRDEALMSLDMLATAVQHEPGVRLRIEGHTDDSPPPKGLGVQTSRDLSYVQARAVAEVLRDRFKVSEVRMALVARGAYEPRATNDTASGRSLNRRVVVVIQAVGGEGDVH